MAFYIVSYDLHKQRNYTPIWNTLVSHGAEKILESLWLIEFNNTAMALRDTLSAYIDNDDSLVVIEIKPGSYWATQRALPKGVEWLKRHILP